MDGARNASRLAGGPSRGECRTGGPSMSRPYACESRSTAFSRPARTAEPLKSRPSTHSRAPSAGHARPGISKWGHPASSQSLPAIRRFTQRQHSRRLSTTPSDWSHPWTRPGCGDAKLTHASGGSWTQARVADVPGARWQPVGTAQRRPDIGLGTNSGAARPEARRTPPRSLLTSTGT